MTKGQWNIFSVPSIQPYLIGTAFAALCVGTMYSSSVEARLTKISVTSTTVVDLPAFGSTGPYQKIVGTYEGELDPNNPRNAVIADIALAPLINGKVQYASTFYILRPVDLSKSGGRLFYMFGNRGTKLEMRLNDAHDSNDPTTAVDFGNGWLNRQGFIIAWSGWDGSATAGPNIMSITLPVPTNPNGSAITGQVVAEQIPATATANTISLPYPANSTDPSNGVLTVRQHQTDPKQPVTGWSYINANQVTFPAPALVQGIYEFVYTAKNPSVMGIGHAATRDFIMFLRNATADDFGTPNPVAMTGGIKAVYSFGRSQGGRVQRDFLYWGFNEDEDGRQMRVIDGMMPYGTGSGGLMWMNFRFAQPSVSSQQHSRHHAHEPEFPHTLPMITDALTGQSDGMMRRCLARNVCPKYMNVDGGNEYWNKSSSLNHTDSMGNDLDIDKLAPNVRIYSVASIQHTAFFGDVSTTAAGCQQLSNPLYQGHVFRALIVALDKWVNQGTLPPPSNVPRRGNGTLVPPEAVSFPQIPATSYAGWPSLPVVQFDPRTMNYNAPQNFDVVPYVDVPGPAYAVQVSQVDSDGNDLGGIRMPFLTLPFGTHTGWAVLAGPAAPDICGQNGQFIPFALTKAARLAAGDPRRSLEERYGGWLTYFFLLIDAIDRFADKGFLLPEDAPILLIQGAQQAWNLGLR